MPKIIELTVELEVQKVSCPGVWLCQDGRVSLSIFLLGTSFQTCMLPPIFPLKFNDVFYFRKRYQESCALNNICCVLKDETIYCELVQWTEDCHSGECTVLGQYLGALNEVLFPPNLCSSDGVDLLMRRSKEFPGILSPKIEIATKVRIDEVWEPPFNLKVSQVASCECSREVEGSRQKQVCHSALYHRSKCNKRTPSAPRSRSRSRSQGSARSCCSLTAEPAPTVCRCPKSSKPTKSGHSLSKSPKHSRGHFHRKRQYSVYNVETVPGGKWPTEDCPTDVNDNEERGQRSLVNQSRCRTQPLFRTDESKVQKHLLESRYIDHEPNCDSSGKESMMRKQFSLKVSPCVCDICRRYHELFHANKN